MFWLFPAVVVGGLRVLFVFGHRVDRFLLFLVFFCRCPLLVFCLKRRRHLFAWILLVADALVWLSRVVLFVQGLMRWLVRGLLGSMMLSVETVRRFQLRRFVCVGLEEGLLLRVLFYCEWRSLSVGTKARVVGFVAAATSVVDLAFCWGSKD